MHYLCALPTPSVVDVDVETLEWHTLGTFEYLTQRACPARTCIYIFVRISESAVPCTLLEPSRVLRCVHCAVPCILIIDVSCFWPDLRIYKVCMRNVKVCIGYF